MFLLLGNTHSYNKEQRAMLNFKLRGGKCVYICVHREGGGKRGG